MAEAHEIIHSVLEAFKGLPGKLARITDKTAELFSSHGREPKTKNPMQTGNVSPVTHYFLYCRQYEAAEKGAGAMLNHRVHAELEMEFIGEVDADCSQKELNAGVLKESFDVLDCLNKHDFQNLNDAQLAACEEEGAQLRDKASEYVSHVRTLRRLRQVNK